MWLSIEVMFLIGLLIISHCLTESDGIISNLEVAIVSDTNANSEIISDNDRIASDKRGSDAKTITFGESGRSDSDNDASDPKTVIYSDNGRSESDSDKNHQSDNNGLTVESSDSDSETVFDRGVQSHGNDQLAIKDTSAVRRNAIPELPTSYVENELTEYLKDKRVIFTPKRFQRNGRQKNDRGKNRQDYLRLNKEERDGNFFEPIRMPQRFEDYDHNKDGYISLRELIDVTGAVINAQYAFSDSDSDNNGKIDEEEFQRAPWDLSGHIERINRKKISSAELV